MAMFRKSTHGDVRKSAQKVSDPKKDTPTRLKHLKVVLENYDIQEVKGFFENNYSHIYYIFYEVFVNVETDLKQRANKAHREELESILQIFEKILLVLPELIHKRWMFHSIGRIMKKLLHPGNSLKLRREGVRLFMIWYQILQENASDDCHQMFFKLVPGLGDTETFKAFDARYGNYVVDSYGGIIAAGEIAPIYLVTGEKQPENLTKYFLEALLTFMVSEVTKVEWLNKEMRETSFVFLFDKFKESYLKWLLPDFKKERSVYEPSLDIPLWRKLEAVHIEEVPSYVSACQDSFIKWLANFAITSRRPEVSVGPGLSCSFLADNASANRSDEDVKESSDDRGDNPDQQSGSQSSTLTGGSQSVDKDSADSSLCSDEHSQSEYEIVRGVLYSTRENVNIVQEIFRQALLFSFEHAAAMKRVISVYKDWFQHVDQRPIFMQEPSFDVTQGLEQRGTPDFHHSSLSDIIEESSSGESSPVPSTPRQMVSLELPERQRTVRNASYLGAIQDLADSGDESHMDVKAGLQRVTQVFITNAANVFLLEVHDENLLNEQVDLCKRVLNIYRYIVMNIPIQQQTWEQILRVLLGITSGVLKECPPLDKHKTLGGRLAQPIFQTLIVTWIKANLNVLISCKLWDLFLEVLSSLTHWEELVREWAKTMETLTRVLAKQVYNLDLLDLPLQRLSEQKEKRRRGKSQGPPKVQNKDAKTFSKAILSPKVSAAQGTSSPGVDVPFERGKSRSEGAGGNKPRPEMSKQRSLSGDPSPAHSRSASNSSDIVLPRSSSDGNLTAPEPDQVLKGASFSSDVSSKSTDTYYSLTSESTGLEDQEVASVTASLLTDSSSVASADTCSSGLHYIQMESSGDNSGEKSDSDTVIRSSQTPSPLSVHSKSGSRTPSPTGELSGDARHVSCPTPDRDSLHIEVVATTEDSTLPKDSESENFEEFKSVLAGGTVQGWTPDVAVVLWRRMLGSLGDINKIKDPSIHATVFDYLCDILDTLLKIRDNQSVTHDNQSSPPPPELIPPQLLLAPWLFEALKLPDTHKRGKLSAYQLICWMLVQSHDMALEPPMVAKLYQVLHHGLVSSDQDVVNVLVRHSAPKYFTVPLPGSTLLLVDFIHAAGTIVSKTDVLELYAPRTAAVSLLGSVICFPNHFGPIPVLQPGHTDLSIITCNNFKDQIINLLLEAGSKEPTSQAKCISISSLGVFLYEELTHGTLHPKLKEAINVLLSALRNSDRQVGKVASETLFVLCDHINTLLNYHPDLPKKIIEVIASNISAMIPSLDTPGSEEDKKLLVSMMFCMVEWTLRVPMPLLLETSDTDKSCLYKVFRVLKAADTGQTTASLARGSVFSLVDLAPEADPNLLKESPQSTGSASPQVGVRESPVGATEHPVRPLSPLPRESSQQRPQPDGVKLAARFLMTHLVNQLYHFPMGSGAARLNSNIQEQHDNPDTPFHDLIPEIFSAPNVQFFVLNHKTLISFVELPALVDVPGGGVTAGLTTAKTVARVILRDLSGKFCWENSVLYGPPWCQRGYVLQESSSVCSVPSDMGMEPLIIDDSDTSLPRETANQRPLSSLPLYENTKPWDDNLNHLLGYIGQTSPECHLIPGEALNIPAPLPEVLQSDAQTLMGDMVLTQKDAETKFYNTHKSDANMLAKPQCPTDTAEPVSPFHMCRLLLDQIGLLSWEKRCDFDLLKKSDKLLRELKHLDSQKCRETHKIAVVYVAEGQEDKNSILSNSGGSRAYEDFVAALGWEVDLENHQGFLGGLQQNRTTGDTAPYYATSSYEVVFHVSTRLPSNSEEANHRKMKHLGNDEVHIIWSEHTREYRRGIIPTEFGDVLLIIYPLHNGLYKIQINRKPEVPYFGPLFNGAILDHRVLPGLVRATAINASRVKRGLIPGFHSHFEERYRSLETIIQHHLQPTTFEDFAANVFAPVLTQPSTTFDQVKLETSVSAQDLAKSATNQLPSPSGSRQSRVPMSLPLRPKFSHLKRRRLPSPDISDSIGRAGDSEMSVFESASNLAAETFIRTARRLSLKGRRTSSTKGSHPTSPPESPKGTKK